MASWARVGRLATPEGALSFLKRLLVGQVRFLGPALAACAWTARTSQAAEPPVEFRSIAENRNLVAPYGPQSPTAPLPPRGPIAPGEQVEHRPEPIGHQKTASRSSPSPRERQPKPVEHREPASKPPRPLQGRARRPVPNLGRPENATTVGDVALWVPRVALFPLYVVSEYGLRKPIGFAMTEAERHHLPSILADFFTFYPDRHAGIVPVVLLDFGFRPSAGVYFFWDRFIASDNDIRAFAATGGVRWWDASVLDRWTFIPGHRVALGGDFEMRPDWIFAGLGPQSSHSDRARFSSERVEGRLKYETDLLKTSRFESWVTVRDVDIDTGSGCCGDPTLASSVASGRLTSPPGARGYTVLRQAAVLDLDSRKDRFPLRVELGEDFQAPSGTGAELVIRGVHATGRAKGPGSIGTDSDRLEWLSYGATVGGFFDVTGTQRTLGLRFLADFAEPLIGTIPFMELVSLGGKRPLRGFLERRLVGRSAVAARLTYTWPVWVWLDGEISYEVGNVFGKQLDGFDPSLLRSSYGIGLRAANRRDHAIELLIATGSRTFRDGAGLESLRALASATTQF